MGERFRLHGLDGSTGALAFIQTTRQERNVAMLMRANFRTLDQLRKWRTRELQTYTQRLTE